MENKIRFRNHISVILEQLGATFGILFVLSFTNIDDVIDYIEKGSSEELSLTVYIGGGVILAVFLLIFLYQWIIWSKTYISICDNSIVIERNTWNKKKNTIGLKNISNVNTEQNLLEMLLGTAMHCVHLSCSTHRICPALPTVPMWKQANALPVVSVWRSVQ